MRYAERVGLRRMSATLAARAVVLGVALAAGCAPGARPAPLGRDHPLVGRIWDVAGAHFVEPDVLTAQLVPRPFVLLGEQHDNPEHHRLQARVVRALIAAGRRPAVGFEMLSLDDAPAIARHLAAAPTDAAGLGAAVHWERSGWPPWPQYQPIAAAALASGLPILAANISRATARAVRFGDLSALDRALVLRYGLDRPPAPAMRRAMADEIRDAHCGHAPESMLDGMIAVQRTRDAQMAESLAVGQRDGAVLIAGAGHVRNDRGVPAYLRARLPGASVASVAFVEVRDGWTRADDYGARAGGGPLPLDYAWFTARADDADPCETFRKSLERLRKSD